MPWICLFGYVCIYLSLFTYFPVTYIKSTVSMANKYFAAVINHARLIFPTNAMVTHKNATTSRVNYCTVRWYPNKETRPRSARLFGPISVKNLMWRHQSRRAFHDPTSFKLLYVVANFHSLRALFRAIYALPVATITIACCCSIVRIRYLSGTIVFPWLS